VKGKDLTDFSPMIQKGILLHRKIDVFTDHHPLFKECVSLLFPIYRHYSRVIIDMYFDHFLASNWDKYHSKNLKVFSNEFYDALKIESENFPENIKNFSKTLIFYNWFDSYKTITGLELILTQMEQRTRFPSKLSASTKQLKENYTYFHNRFSSFMEEVIDFTKNEIKNL
jgi:acyl carrier protein phosphodiesterase